MNNSPNNSESSSPATGLFGIPAADVARHASSSAFGTSITAGPGSFADIDGISIGHASEGDTGVTVIAAPSGATGAVDVRGGGPGTRETDLLAPENTVERAHAIVLAGGSAFGLAAADGVMRELRDRGIGFEITPTRPDILVPIVPGAVIFDLLLGEPTLPTAQLGREALSHALDDDSAASPSGTIGAGTGAMAGAIKGGFGQAKVTSADGKYFVAAAMVVNSFGAVIDDEGHLYGMPTAAGVSREALAKLDEVFVGRTKVLTEEAGQGQPSQSTRNTTIGTLVTNAPLSTAQLKRLAMCGHDGLARAIRPAHAPMDGDTLFALSTGNLAESEGLDPEVVALLTAMAADAVQMAIVDAVLSASGRAGVAAVSEMRAK
ncbi:MAG: P1 family peptidase [Corynebacterium sp.]|uniref:P1 family peptidase n=1 Tax=Corynebacterium sp. TaxID=1720 RepID=UPI0026DA9B0F|nr:P1 family peptidase [Corynebacterium sp.]MDO5030732.1 P1 family peptidase [Corynebacterium sp.]